MICYRKKSGKGFRYLNAKGNIVTDEKLVAYFKSLVIPPAWRNVCIDTSRRAKIRAFGYDAKERKQYIYNSKFREQQDLLKFDRIIKFASKLGQLRSVTARHLRQRKLSREKVLATMLQLLDRVYFRVGNDHYAKNGSYGLTTLRSRHLTVNGDKMVFSFVGKSGIRHERQIVDPRLARIISELDDMPGYEIFKFIDENNQIQDVKSSHLNEYIRQVMGEEFSAKDFRTWSGTVIAATALSEIGAVGQNDFQGQKKNLRIAVLSVSKELGNTPAIARSSYIHPHVIENYLRGITLADFKDSVRRLSKTYSGLSREEIGVLCLLKSSASESSSCSPGSNTTK